MPKLLAAMLKASWIVGGVAAASLLLASGHSSAARPPAPAGPNTNLARVIDALTLLGKISPQGAAQLSRAALEQGEGPRFTFPTMPGGRPPCLTQAIQLTKSWAHSKGVGVFSVPPPSVGFVASETLPLRVYYQTEEDKFTAEQSLVAAEQAWQNQVVDVGYPMPFTGDGESGEALPGLWIYIADLGMPGAGGYTEWLDDVPMTPVSDCSSRVAIDRSNPSDYITATIIHEFNHATQMATDCVESISAWENFTSAVENHYTGEDWMFSYLVEVFQRYPEYPIDFWAYPDGVDEMSYYQYGAALFPIFLNERYGSGGIKMLRDLWYSFAQAGTLHCSPLGCSSDEPNHPNWFEGTEAVLGLHGSGFDRAFDEFSVWRALTGTRNDHQHFKNAAHYPSVSMAAEHSLAGLPAKGELELQEYGSRYIKLTPDSFKGGLTIRLEVDPEAAWFSTLLLGRQGQPVDQRDLPIEMGQAILSVPSVQGASWALLVVSQHSEGEHDPDEMEYYTTRTFRYSIEAVLPEPGPEPLPEAGPDAKEAGVKDAAPVVANDSHEADGGCGCRVTGNGSSQGGLALLGLAALAAIGRRRYRALRPVGLRTGLGTRGGVGRSRLLKSSRARVASWRRSGASGTCERSSVGAVSVPRRLT